MATKLTNEDVDFLTELVEQEITRVVGEKVEEVKAQVAQTFVDLAVKQLEYFGFTFGEATQDGSVGQVTGPLPVGQSANGQANHDG